jgi:hypothetical protein
MEHSVVGGMVRSLDCQSAGKTGWLDGWLVGGVVGCFVGGSHRMVR